MPGGRNALTSSNFKESKNDGFLDLVVVGFSVDVLKAFVVVVVLLVASLVFWNNLGGLGLDLFLLKSGKGPKSLGKSLAKSSCSILDKISSIKLVSVVVVVVDSSNLKPGGKNLLTSSCLILEILVLGLLNVLGGFLLLKPLGNSELTSSLGILESKSPTV